LRVRLALVFSANDVNDEIAALDASIDTLDRFSNNLRRLRHLEEALPSQKATKLAKSLRTIRRYTEDLHDALSQCWRQSCHDDHEAKLFLEARLAEADKSMPRRTSPCVFQLVLHSKPSSHISGWHETTCHADNEDDLSNSTINADAKVPQVKIVAPATSAHKPKPGVIQDICVALKKAESDKKLPSFHLMDPKKLGMSLSSAKPFTMCKARQSVTLREVLDDMSGANTKKYSLPLHARMLLALTLSSSLLQCLNTPWNMPALSASNVEFLLDEQGQQPEILRPYVSARFAAASAPRAAPLTLIKTSLQELGILLLELWHTAAFESKYPAPTHGALKNHRLACALDWFDDVQNPLLEHYYTAVNNCIVRVARSEPGLPDWDDHKLWRAICEGVIDPLHKVVQQWPSAKP
jgi:hypothetical protein